MEKSLTLVLPDRPGALREVAHLLAKRHVSVLRAHYNRVIDVHTLFLDVSGTQDQRRRVLVLTHADIDHVGDCARFDEVYASGRVIDNFMFESLGIVSWREQNPYGMPYVFIGRILCGYKSPDYKRMRCLGEPSPFGEQRELLERIDTLEIAPFAFEVWEGKGGHVRGETMLIDRKQRVCVSGDVFVNVHGETKPQAQYNALGPFLMTSVDSVPKLAREERMALFDLLDDGTWQILGGHGSLCELQR